MRALFLMLAILFTASISHAEIIVGDLVSFGTVEPEQLRNVKCPVPVHGGVCKGMAYISHVGEYVADQIKITNNAPNAIGSVVLNNVFPKASYPFALSIGRDFCAKKDVDQKSCLVLVNGRNYIHVEVTIGNQTLSEDMVLDVDIDWQY